MLPAVKSPFPRFSSLLLLTLLAAFGCSKQESDPSVEHLTSARFGIVDSDWPPSDDELTETVELPDFWNLERPRAAGIGWYRIPVEIPKDRGEPWGVYLPSSSSSLKVFVAGEQRGPTGIGPDDNVQNWDRPEAEVNALVDLLCE